MNVFGLSKRVSVLCVLTQISACFILSAETQQPLVRTENQYAQEVPLIVVTALGQTPTLVKVKLHWQPKIEANEIDEALTFDFKNPSDPKTLEAFRAQMWLAAIGSTVVSQQPWLAAHWEITGIPKTDGSGLSAGLGVGLVAISSGHPIPQDIAVIGNLNADGSLSAVTHLAERISIAAKSGIKHVIIPTAQKMDERGNKELVNVAKLAAELGLRCTTADTLLDAVEQTLKKDLSMTPPSTVMAQVEGKVFDFLEKQAREELGALEKNLALWPQDPTTQTSLSRANKRSWEEIFTLHEKGMEQFRNGRVYAARTSFEQANARSMGLTNSKPVSEADIQTALNEGDALIKSIDKLKYGSTFDKDEVASALFLAERNEALTRITSELDGALVLARQTHHDRSNAPVADRQKSRELLAFALAQSKYSMKCAAFYDQLAPLVVTSNVPDLNRGTLLLPQLTSTLLSSGEHFSSIIASANFAENVTDTRVLSHARTIRDLQYLTNRQAEMKKFKASLTSVQPGFDPGTAYSAPQPTVAIADLEKVSDTARCFLWVNAFAETSYLENKYGQDAEKKITDQDIRSARLQVLSKIKSLTQANIPTTIILLSLERADSFASIPSFAGKMEAAREYRRAALLGHMAWLLGSKPDKKTAFYMALHSPEAAQVLAERKAPKPPAIVAAVKSPLPVSTSPVQVIKAEKPVITPVKSTNDPLPVAVQDIQTPDASKAETRTPPVAEPVNSSPSSDEHNEPKPYLIGPPVPAEFSKGANIFEEDVDDARPAL